LSAFSLHPVLRIPGRLRHASLVLAIGFAVLGLTACGGEEDGGSSEGELEGADRRERIVSISESLESELGVEDGFNALIYAWERGYSHDQVFPAIEDARLQANGQIEAAGGGTEEPEGPRLGVVILPDTAALPSVGLKLASYEAANPSRGARALLQEPNLTAERLWELAKIVFGVGNPTPEELGQLVLTTIVDLGIAGYSPEQITEAIVLGGDFGDEVFQPTNPFEIDFDCPVLRDAAGKVVVPAFRGDESRCDKEIEALASREARDQASEEEEDAPSQEDESAEGNECPGLSDEVCAHSGTHVYTQQSNREACPEANPITERTDYTITFEAGSMTVHSHHFGWTFTLEQTSPTTFEDATRTWEFEGPTITRTSKTNCIVYIMTRAD